MSQSRRRYIDEYQNVHNRDKVLGQGGQGIVFRTKDPDLAIKLVTDESGRPLTDTESLKKYSQRLKKVRLLPLPEGLNLSVPAALLIDSAGYVMQLLSEMGSLSSFWLDGKSSENISEKDIPDWLSVVPNHEAKKIVHYYRTGGLRRRLTVLYKCAALLARLHGYGLVYGDMSPNNIFVSDGIEHSSVWLIDADNIRFEILSGGSGVYTPKFGAPELVQGLDGGRPSSDCHAFAVVAFYLLSLIHPFVGNRVDGTADVDWADEGNDDEDVEEKAYAGFFPWVDDLNDNSNSTDSGLPRQLLLTDKLKTLFQRTFSEGRTCSWMRPTIYHWPEALAQATDSTIQCPGCDMTYYYDSRAIETDESKCPYCSCLSPRLMVLDSYDWCGNGTPLKDPCWKFAREIDGDSPIIIPKRLFAEFTLAESDSHELEISICDKFLLMKKFEQGSIDISVAVDDSQHGRFQRIISQTKIEGAQSELRFWIFADSKNPRLIFGSIIGGDK